MEENKKEPKDFGMTGDEIFRTLSAGLDDAQSGEAGIGLNTFAHTQMLWLHARTLACHCECLGMNTENALAVCGDYTPPYNDAAYYRVMEKWGLINKKGEPTI